MRIIVWIFPIWVILMGLGSWCVMLLAEAMK